MFCGFPVKVATLPTFAAVTSAIRYGTGGSASWRVASSTTGARTRHTTSLTKKADRTPEATTTVPSSIRGVRARRRAHVITSRKKPERRRYAVTIIIPNSSTRVGASTAATASVHGTAPEATMTAAPMIATPVRSIRKPGTRPSASPT
jgi:hypothetical protein